MQEFLDALQRHLEKEHPFELSVSEHDAKSVNFAKKVKRVPKSNRKTKKSEKSGVP
jgi:autotransporter translocation and assembly factor TamB